MTREIKKVIIPRSAILKRVEELAHQISEDYAGRSPIFIGILNGVVFFFTDLIMRLKIPCRIDFIRASSYGAGKASSGTIRLVKDVELPVEGKDLIVVEDIVDTGLTLRQILKLLAGKNPASLKICALIDKKERRTEDIALDYCGFKVEEGFLVGYGLDFDERYRYLPDICTLE